MSYKPPMSGTKFALIFITLIAGGVTVFVAALMLLNWPYASHTCEVRADKMQMEGEWTFWGDCRVQLDNGRWVSIDDYRVIEELNDDQ